MDMESWGMQHQVKYDRNKTSLEVMAYSINRTRLVRRMMEMQWHEDEEISIWECS